MLAILGSLGALTYLVPYQRSHHRQAEIKEILANLKSLGSNPNYQSAVKLNIEFFRAVRNPFSFAWWLMVRAPKLRKDRTKIVELLDLPFPKWQKSVLETLSWFEVWMRALVPIKYYIIKELDRLQGIKQEPIIVANFGCGGMELERQIIYELLRRRFSFPLVLVGIDYSPASFEVAASKFRNLESKGLVEIKAIPQLGSETLRELKAGAVSRRPTVVLLHANAFDLKELPKDSFDLVYHSRLRHHLTPSEGDKMDKLASHLAPKAVELDDIFSVLGVIIISIFVWRFPAVLNGAVLSYLRDFSRKELASKKEAGWNVVLTGKPLTSYLRAYHKISPP